jgi:hypothetical protein
MSECDAPIWFIELVRSTWGEAEWRAWEEVWKPKLAERGVTPDMLSVIGGPTRPLAISALGKRMCSGKISWEDGDTAVLDAIRLLVAELDAAAGPS